MPEGTVPKTPPGDGAEFIHQAACSVLGGDAPAFHDLFIEDQVEAIQTLHPNEAGRLIGVSGVDVLRPSGH